MFSPTLITTVIVLGLKFRIPPK